MSTSFVPPDAVTASVLSDLVYHSVGGAVPEIPGWTFLGSQYVDSSGYYAESWGKQNYDSNGAAIPGDQANQVVGDATRQRDLSSHGLTPTAKPMTDLVFEARLKPNATAMSVNGQAVPLAAGMTVTVEIKTGSRRIINYLFSPVIEVVSSAMREQ